MSYMSSKNYLRVKSSESKQLINCALSIWIIQQQESMRNHRIIMPLIASCLFIAAFVVNITSDDPLYNIDLNEVPSMQNNKSLGSSAFISFMNVISNIFNPVICAGYVAIFYLISSRKLEIMVFLIWFILLSWFLSIVKELIHQPRPYWIAGAGVQMLEWTCYSEYGCPSGHSMLGLVLMEFIIRFFARGYKFMRMNIIWFYVLVLILQFLVMFSRVILGMHTFNEVLMGFACGSFAISIYYTNVESLVLKLLQKLITSTRKSTHLLIFITSMVLCCVLQVLITYLPTYSSNQYWSVINSIQGCSSVKLYKSFQYKCFEDSALIMAAFGLLISLLYMSHPQDLAKPLAYTRFSWKFIGKLVIMIVSAIIPIAVFLNPGWGQINASDENMALITWACQNLGFLGAVLMLLLAAPPICRRAGLQQYKDTQYVAHTSIDAKQVQIGQNFKNCFSN